MADDDLELDDQIEGEDEAELEDEEVVDPAAAAAKDDEPDEPVVPRSRANDRIQSLRDQARRAQERADDVERQLQQLRYEHQQREAAMSQVSEEERLQNMTFEERVQYQLAKATDQQRRFEQQQKFQMAETSDRAEFQQIVRQTPEFEKLAPQVEQELQALRQQMGMNVPRRLVLATLIGLQTMASTGQVKQQRAQGKANIARQKTAPSGGQSDVQSQRRKQQSPRDRLEGIVF